MMEAKEGTIQERTLGMNTEPAISFLRTLTFNVRTNLAKGRINNRDAIAYLLYKCGPMRLSEIRDAMMEWRFGKAEYTSQTYQDYNYETKTSKPVQRKVAKMGFSYAFNSSSSGGYGCVAENPMTRGVWMNAGKYANGISHRQEYVKGETFFRRQYWWRAGKGIYAPSLECMKRMRELNLV